MERHTMCTYQNTQHYSILKLIYRFNVIPTKLSAKNFVQIEKHILKLAEDSVEK